MPCMVYAVNAVSLNGLRAIQVQLPTRHISNCLINRRIFFSTLVQNVVALNQRSTLWCCYCELRLIGQRNQLYEMSLLLERNDLHRTIIFVISGLIQSEIRESVRFSCDTLIRISSVQISSHPFSIQCLGCLSPNRRVVT